MLVQNSIYRNTYLTDGVNKDFYFSFPILEASQVLVQTSALTDTDTVTTVDPSQYTVTGAGQVTGGHISFTTAPPTGSRIALTLSMPITQLYQYAELDSFPAKSHEDALAKLTLICQQLKEQISRAVLISATSEGSTADFIASLYAARDSATTSATAADLSATSAEVSATSAGASATAAQQSADSAAANSAGLAAEVQNLSTMFIGTVLPIICADSYVPNCCVPTNGGEYTRSQFPSLYDTYLAGGKLLTCTYTEWSAQVGLTGNCARFALDADAQKFKVPLLKDGDSTTVTDEQIRLRHFVVVASAQNNASVFDWSAYMAGLAGKANIDLSNVTGNAIGLYAYFRDEKAAGTSGGSTSATTWQTRDLNTAVKNFIPGVSLAGNRITLPPGRYYIRASVPVYIGVYSRAALYDYTNSTYLLYSPSCFTSSSGSGFCLQPIEGEITLTSETTLELRMWVSAANAAGMGINTSPSGVKEIFSELRIWKL